MDYYSLPIAKRTRAKEEEMFREMHKAYKKIKIQKQHGSSNAESMSIDALIGKKSCRNGEESGNLGPDLSPVVLDDSDEDVVFIGVVEETKGKEYVSTADDDDDVGLYGSQVVEEEENQAEEVEKENEDQLYMGKPIMRKPTGAVYINDASDDAVVRNDADIAEIELGKTNDTPARCNHRRLSLMLFNRKR